MMFGRFHRRVQSFNSLLRSHLFGLPVASTTHYERLAGASAQGAPSSELQELEPANLLKALDACGWKIAGPHGTAARLGMKPSTLTSRMKALGIRRKVGV